MVLRNLLRRKMRTLLTLVGIAMGIAAIVTLVALSRGIVANYLEITSSSDADLTIQAVQGQGQAITLGTGFDERLADRIRAMPEVKSVSALLYTMVQMADTPFFIVFGLEPDGLRLQRYKIVEGVSLAGVRGRRGGKPIMLGTIAADKLKKGVGDTVRLEQTTFRIVGIYETGIALEDSGGVIELADAQILADMPRQVMYLGVRLHNPARAEEFKAKLSRMLPKDVEIAGTQIGNTLLEALELLDVFAWGVAIIAALVGGVGMMNTMLMSVFERTREIGVLRALGWRSRHVLTMILGESLLLSLAGGAIGLGMGAGLTWLAANSPTMAGLTRDTIPAQLVTQALTTALVLGVVGGMYPAWRASMLVPVEALHYDGGATGHKPVRIRWGSMALRNLGRQRTRTILTFVGVGIGMLAILLIGSLGEGTVTGFNQLFGGTEITVVQAGQPDTSLSSIQERVLRRIEALPEVQYVSGLIFSVVSTPRDPFFVVNARARNDPMLSRLVVREGRLLGSSRECVLGWRAAAQQNRRIGDRLSILGTRFTIVGIIESGNTFEDNGAIIELQEAQRLLKKPNQVMAAQIKLVDPEQTDAVLERLKQEYPGLLFSKSTEFAESLPDMQMTEQSIQVIFLMTTLVGSIALMNTMIMSIYERTREIGVLRAVGWRKSRVLAQILGESLLVTLTSGAIGALLTWGFIQVFRTLPSTGFYRDLFVLTPRVLVQTLFICVLLGVIGGLYPAWRASRFSPVEALRYE